MTRRTTHTPDAGQAPGASPLPRNLGGRPPHGLGPEYQEVVRLALEGATPRAIERQLGREPGWARSAMQWLRSIGALGPDTKAKGGRPRVRPIKPRRVVLALDLELAAALDRERGATPADVWVLDLVRRTLTPDQ